MPAGRHCVGGAPVVAVEGRPLPGVCHPRVGEVGADDRAAGALYEVDPWPPVAGADVGESVARPELEVRGEEVGLVLGRVPG